ncbi:glycosyltransferase [Nocardioides ganghwensis]|uniref:Glycosyltransferase n=1 Tax=Nocardioides ganghwensis TaxID=252230 RepID=A0A4Q2SCP7_9ACTN|nr:glycosyltransferase [Nocardioides ganghwensis]MBD3947440.1 glycosyltransferase [Nocardioides ganghwensis]RYB99910.1 glycosyltransferase [Nocardioides ganghwensis]
MTQSLQRTLDEVQQAPFVVDVLRSGDRLAAAAGGEGGPAPVRLLADVIDERDELTAVAAVHALAQVCDDGADAVLADLLSHPRPFLREHASWALRTRLPRLDAVGRLVGVVVGGGFSGMLAQRTLARWAVAAPQQVSLSIEDALVGAADAAVRSRLVETLGLVPGPIAGRALRELALEDGEHPTVRLAAVAALGDRPDDDAAVAVVRHLGTADGDVGAVARLAAIDLGIDVVERGDAGHGLTVAQLFLHADIDRDLSRAGAGDNGGVATLLVRLGDALAAGTGVDRVLTLSRGTPGAALDALTPADGHLLTPVPLLPEATSTAQAWPSRVAAERGIRRVLRTYRPDVLHLRMAEVGSLAAAEVARDLGIPVVFTLAPDPHAVIHALDMTGGLHRGNFGTEDEREHYWFRARLVQRLAEDSAHIVLFPRPELQHDMRELLGLDVAGEPGRYTVVPEGVDLGVSAAAAAEVEGPGAPGPALAELDALLAALPEHRRGLPLAISVGRLHRVKGMATLVEAWAGDAELSERCNLLVVGGDLADPSPDERQQLDLIDEVLARFPTAADGLVMPGHRPNDVVAVWLAAARAGRPGGNGPDGVYVCSSLKEEFGLALLEALASGLVVVGPAAGGPATYIDDGVTGVLVDTRRPDEVARAMRAAFDLATAPGQAERIDRALDRVRADFTVQAMADRLSRIYAGAVRTAGRS